MVFIYNFFSYFICFITLFLRLSYLCATANSLVFSSIPTILQALNGCLMNWFFFLKCQGRFNDLYQWHKDKIDVIVNKLAKKDDTVKKALELNKADILASANRNFQSMRAKLAKGLNKGLHKVLTRKITDDKRRIKTMLR